MLEKIFKAVVLTSCIGAALTMVLALSKPITKKIFSAEWHYYIWLVALGVMAFPVKFDVPSQAVAQMPKQVKIFVDAGRTVMMPTAQAEVFRIGLADIWLAGTVLMFSLKLLSYIFFLHRIRKGGVGIFCPGIEKYTNRKITVIKLSETTTPLMTGLFKPMLILPDADLTEQQMSYVLAHEMTHFKRKDILYKWVVCLVKCIHWFNPAIYFASRQIDIECEISCDLAVTERMNKEEKLAYVDTILALVSTVGKKLPLTTGMVAKGGVLKRRIRSIAKMRKNGKFIKFFSVTAAAICLIGTMFMSGAAAGLLLNEIDERLILCGRLPVIEFAFKQTVEQPEKNSQPAAQPDYVEEQTELPEPAEEEKVSQEEAAEVETQKTALTGELSSSVFEKPEDAKVIKYNSDDKATHYITLQPDENGLISVYFDSEVNNALATVNIYDSKRPGQGWRYGLPTDGQAAYEFEGFDPEKTYTVEINTYCPGNYGIEGKAYIY